MTYRMTLNSDSSRGQIRYIRRSRLSLLDLLAVARERRALSKLSASQLDDIGVDPIDAAREAKRSFWDAPDSWILRR